MDYIEVEGKTYEEAIKKASLSLNVDEKDLIIDVTEVDTKGILGLLGSKKVRIIARIRGKDDSPPVDEITAEEYGKELLRAIANYFGVLATIVSTTQENRVIFSMKSENAESLIGKDGEVLEAIQYILKLAIAKRFKQSQKVTIDINNYRESRKKNLASMAKNLADKAKRTRRSIKTDPLNPYERRIIHTLFKNNKGITTKSEGEGHIKRIIIIPTGTPHGRR